MASKIQAPAPVPAPKRKPRVKAFVPQESRRRSTRERVEVNYAERYGLEDAGDDDLAAARRASRASAPASKRKADLVSMSDGDHARVRYSVGRRVYDSELGTTCHWCRQKTVETHVTCTAEGCGRGRMPVSFCGMCLRNRHGEDIDAAVASGAWVCPRCRGSCGEGCVTCCNCGPCRKANGLAPTHQVINLARASGFDNVHDYLVHGATGATPEQLLRRKTSFAWGAWLLSKADFAPATPTESDGAGVRESGDDTSADGAYVRESDAFDDEPCLACAAVDRPEDFVLCDGCPRGGHFDCLGLRGVPAGDWFCAGCEGDDPKAVTKNARSGRETGAEKKKTTRATSKAVGTPDAATKRRPGRPRKNPSPGDSPPGELPGDAHVPATPSPTKRRPGRPKKTPATPLTSSPSQTPVLTAVVTSAATEVKRIQLDIRDAFSSINEGRCARAARPKPGAMALPVREYRRRVAA
uniref:PHD-type domain-containing protein n=1 Tax=Micromonas pusilla TaxID=38833 RepID=A0A7S0PT87_MICPS